MIIGTGIDIVEISRIKKLIENGTFTERFFSERENAYFSSKKYAPETVAGAFCAKEAFSKALGTGIRGFGLKEVEVLHDDLGKPYLVLSGDAKNAAEKSGIKKLFLSVSHSDFFAVANVIAEGEN